MTFEQWQDKYWEQLCADYEESARYSLETFEQFCKTKFEERRDFEYL